MGTNSEVNLDDDAEVDRTIRAAARAVLRDHKASGEYVVGWQDGKVVRIAAEDIVIPGENTI